MCSGRENGAEPMSHLMILPSRDSAQIRLVRVPADFERQEAFRHVTSLIAAVESSKPDCGWDDIAERLESQGYEMVDFLLGPSLD
jgi:hypothetical protein